MKVTKAWLLILLLDFLVVHFFPSELPSCFRLLSSPPSLEHCLIVHLFSLCMRSLPPLFTFISRLLFLFNSPWFSLSFSVLPIFSAALPFSPLAFQSRMLLRGPVSNYICFVLFTGVSFSPVFYRSHLFLYISFSIC